MAVQSLVMGRQHPSARQETSLARRLGQGLSLKLVLHPHDRQTQKFPRPRAMARKMLEVSQFRRLRDVQKERDAKLILRGRRRGIRTTGHMISLVADVG
jgi:hypothetical protein